MCVGGGGHVSMNAWHYCAGWEGVCLYMCIPTSLHVSMYNIDGTVFAILYVSVYAND